MQGVLCSHHMYPQPRMSILMLTEVDRDWERREEEGEGSKDHVIFPLPRTSPLWADRDGSLSLTDLARDPHPYLMDKCYSIWGLNNL